MVKETLSRLIEGEVLTASDARGVMNEIMSGNATASQIASIVTILRMRGEAVSEMVGFAQAMKEHAVAIPHVEQDVMDTCGTGGDKAKTFNISTATAIVLSALGVKVAKHGNRAVSSKSGSADVLEKLGISIQSTPEQAAASLKDYGMCFLFAPNYHHAMKHAAEPRKDIGFRTIFNLLGPMSNPANAKRQLIGVFDTSYAEKMAETLRELGTERAMLVTGREGLDECSITTMTDIVELRNGEITRYTLIPEEVGLQRGSLEDIQVSSSEESAAVIERILQSTATTETSKDIVILNSAAGLYTAGAVSTIKEGVSVVQEAFIHGNVKRQYERLRQERDGTHVK